MKPIPLFAVHMPAGVEDAVTETLFSGYVAEGPRVADFERLFAQWFGMTRVVATNSGTSALTLAYRLAGVGRGHEVITTPMTCSATNLPILQFGATPVWADIDPTTGLIDPVDVRRKMTERTRAIVCVDWGGMPCDLDTLLEIAQGPGIFLIEDAAHALGARYHARPVGVSAHFTAFSFQAIKHITTGDGGLLAVGLKLQGETAYQRARDLKWFGIDRDATTDDNRIDVDIREAGYKFHMNDIAATIGIAQFPHIGRILGRHRFNAEYYSQNLPPAFERLTVPVARDSAWWLYTVLLPNQAVREEFKVFMRRHGIQVSQVHRRNDTYKVFERYERLGELPGVDAFSSRMICLPVHWALSPADRERVVEACRAFAGAGAEVQT